MFTSLYFFVIQLPMKQKPSLVPSTHKSLAPVCALLCASIQCQSVNAQSVAHLYFGGSGTDIYDGEQWTGAFLVGGGTDGIPFNGGQISIDSTFAPFDFISSGAETNLTENTTVFGFDGGSWDLAPAEVFPDLRQPTVIRDGVTGTVTLSGFTPGDQVEVGFFSGVVDNSQVGLDRGDIRPLGVSYQGIPVFAQEGPSIFPCVPVDENGELEFEFFDPTESGQDYYLTAMRVTFCGNTAIPEPGTTGLAMLGSLSLLLRRRKRSA